ncbi:MAG TPA: hypothetical protein VFS30_12345 [Dehalococcoidia bacterium]|nr:hypothetical protein [Dehalococcoidia bacterium]
MRLHLVMLAASAALLVACFGGADEPATPTATPEPLPAAVFDEFAVGRPQNRVGVGDAERALARFETTRGDLIAAFREQGWFRDGLSEDESIFVERSLSFVAGHPEPSFESIHPQAVSDKLYIYDTLQLSQRKVGLLLIYEPGDDAESEFALLKAVIAQLEREVGIEWPEPIITVVNGSYGINDYDSNGFIRIDGCCKLAAFILAHELSHVYWTAGPFWFNEGMADIYATLSLQALSDDPPEPWGHFNADIDDYYAQRKSVVDSAGFPQLPLPNRFASDGLYQAADVFLLTIRDIIGADAFRDAARDIYAASDFARLNISEKRLEDIVLRYTSDSNAGAVMQLFNREVWGDNGEEYQRLKEFEGS